MIAALLVAYGLAIVVAFLLGAPLWLLLLAVVSWFVFAFLADTGGWIESKSRDML